MRIFKDILMRDLLRWCLPLCVWLAGVSCLSAVPTITNQPDAKDVRPNTSLILSVSASGSGTLSYQWYKDGEPISAATTDLYIVAKVSLEDAGVYTVVVTDADGSTTSDEALVRVLSPPEILNQTESVAVQPGGSIYMEVEAVGFPEPTYQWQFEGRDIGGATDSAYTIASATFADTGAYTVVVSNDEGDTVGGAVAVAVLGDTTLTGAMEIYRDLDDVPIDIPVHLRFSETIQPGTAGRIRIREADGTLVDVVDIAEDPNTRLIGGEEYRYLPVLVEGNEAWIYLDPGVLEYGTTYFVSIEAGVVRNEAGEAVAGISGDQVIRFTTRAAPPVVENRYVTVSPGGGDDFATIQGAIDFVPPSNSGRFHVFVRDGTYREILHISNEKPLITLEGQSMEGVVVAYENNANFAAGGSRGTFHVEGDGLILSRMTFINLTPKGGSQAETLLNRADNVIVRECSFLSLQDTIRSNGTIHFYRSYIEGDVDFLWGSGPAFLEECTIHSVNPGYLTQIRNAVGQRGFVFVDCRLTGADGAGNSWLSRIDQDAYPGSEVVFIDCAMGDHVPAPGWLLNGSGSTDSLRFLEYGSTDLQGNPLDLSGRIDAATVIDEALAGQYRDVNFVLGRETAEPLYRAGMRAPADNNWPEHPSFGWIQVHELDSAGNGFLAYLSGEKAWAWIVPGGGSDAWILLLDTNANSWAWHHSDAPGWLWDPVTEQFIPWP